jgi:hypothetical protein
MSDGMEDQGSMHQLDPAFCRSMGSQHHFLNGVGDAASQVTLHNHVFLSSHNVRMKWH